MQLANGLLWNQKSPIASAVIVVIAGLTYKQGDRVNAALYRRFRLVNMSFKTEGYLTAGSTARTTIRSLA